MSKSIKKKRGGRKKKNDWISLATWTQKHQFSLKEMAKEFDTETDVEEFVSNMLGDLKMQLNRAVLFYYLLSDADMTEESEVQKQAQNEILTKMYNLWKNADGTWKRCGRCVKCIAAGYTTPDKFFCK